MYEIFINNLFIYSLKYLLQYKYLIIYIIILYEYIFLKYIDIRSFSFLTLSYMFL